MRWVRQSGKTGYGAKIWIFAAVAACMASHMDLVAYAGGIDSDYQEELVEFESLIDEITDYVTEMDPSEKGEDSHYGELCDLIDEASELVSGYLDEETGDWVGSVPTLEQLEDMEQRLREKGYATLIVT